MMLPRTRHILAVFLLLWAPGQAWAVSDAAVAEGLQVSLEYSMMEKDGTKIESNVGPVTFVQGSHHLVPGLEQAINGMKAGQKKRVEVPAEQAFGPYDADAQLKVPKKNVPPTVKVGDVLTRPSDRKPMRVLQITSDTVVLDMNHPLAGKDLVFEVKILKIERSSAKP